MRKLIGGSIVTALVLVALGGATLANAATPSTAFAARAASLVTRASAPGQTTSSFATPFASIAPTVAPSIGGTPEVDDLLTADPGSWPGTGLAFTYQWFDCDPSDVTSCTVIPAATASTYTVDPADGDSVIVVQVDATDGGGDSGSATSGPTAVVTAQPGAPVEASDPTIGSVTGGVTSTPTIGTWNNGPTSFIEAWLACSPDLSSCSVAADANESGQVVLGYTPTAADVGQVLVFAVIASNAAGDSVEALSTPSAPVSFPPPTASIAIPAAIQYPTGTSLTTIYSCTPPPGMALASCVGTVPSGSTLVVALGDHAFAVTATDADGQTRTVSELYGGFGLPTVALPTPTPTTPATLTITAPANGATVVQGSVLDLTYACPGICYAQQQPNPSGAPPLNSGQQLDTTQLGVHTVTAQAQITPIWRSGGSLVTGPGSTQTATATYTVVPPPLTVTALSQSSAKWKPGNALPAAITAHAASHGPGARFSFVANRPATITYTFSRLVAGRVQGKACVAATHANRRAKACTRSLPSEVMTLPATSGANVVSFQGRLNSSARLRPGRYCVTVAAQATSQPAGPAIQVGTLRFTIVK